MNIRSRLSQLEKCSQEAGDSAAIKAHLEKIWMAAKSTPRMKLEPDSIYWLPPNQCIADKIFMPLFKKYGVSTE